MEEQSYILALPEMSASVLEALIKGMLLLLSVRFIVGAHSSSSQSVGFI